MPIHAFVTKRFDVASISDLTSGTPMLRRPPMRFLVLLPIVLLAAASLHALMYGQNVDRRHHDHEHKRTERAQIVAIEQQCRQATLDDDAPAMDKLLSEDYLGITASGEVLTKTQQLDRMRERKLVVSSLQTSEVKIKLVGNIAIVTSLARVEGSDNGEPLHGAFRYTRVYQRMAGGVWKITSFEVTPANRSHPADAAQN
jgi:ketosteroid isomerase-like protein